MKEREEDLRQMIEYHMSRINQCHETSDYQGMCEAAEALVKLAYAMDYLNGNVPREKGGKVLYIKYRDDLIRNKGEIISKTFPMEQWIGDWCYGHRFVPYNSVEILEAELDGKPILDKITKRYHSPCFWDIASYFDWIGKRDAYIESVGQHKSQKQFEEWLEQNWDSIR